MQGMGEKLRAARLHQNFSLRELAAKAEVSASLLSQIETGKANPSVRSLHSIADALSLPVDHFFPGRNDEDDGESGTVDGVVNVTSSQLRAGQAAALLGSSELPFADGSDQAKGPLLRCSARATIELEGGVTWSRLTPRPEDNVEFLHICYEVGASSGARMSRHVGREFGLILEGELLLELGFERYLVKVGDSVIFDSSTPHRLTNAGQVPLKAIWVIFNQE